LVINRQVLLTVLGVVPVALAVSIAVDAQDRDTLKAPNGFAFADIKGFDTWPDVAPSQTDDGIKSIVANSVMLNAYKQGVPGNGKRFPDTNGWDYAQFTYDAASDSFKPVGTGAGFGKTECHQCHTRVKANDYIFTNYAKR
jgi:hypothetical protein